ncbi:MAG: choice-of-anchor B family protein, partial [Planctomycetota bacterium]|nr:choice-of-anchor B family protein [Planctomycetota bacterium]
MNRSILSFHAARFLATKAPAALLLAGGLMLGASLLFVPPVEAARDVSEMLPTSEDVTPVTGKCDNYRCGCGDFCGCGSGCACGSSTAPVTLRGATGFDSQNVILRSRISVQDFGDYSGGNDCWGYVSPSGREYALMGLNEGTAVVEITDPFNPVIVGQIPHSSSPWSDVKVFGEYAYSVNESSGGVQIIDLTQVDQGVVSLVGNYTANGINTNHNIAINPDSGYAYLCGSNAFNGGLIALDLSNPTQPTFAGAYTAVYVHDAQIVSFDSGPYAGREIAFCFVGGSGLDIVDVTNKGNMVRLSRTPYSGLRYSHQGWFDPDRMVVHLNDELDERDGFVSSTTTRIFDVSSLTSPKL